MADRRPFIRLLLFQPSGDPLRRPAGLQALDHVLTQGGVGGRLPAALPASARQVLRVQREVAADPAAAVAEAVPAQLAIDGGRVAAEPGRDLADRGAGLDQAEEGAALVEVEVAVGPGQRRLRGAIPWEGWGFAPRDRTHLLALLADGVPRRKPAIVEALADRHDKQDVTSTLIRLTI